MSIVARVTAFLFVAGALLLLGAVTPTVAGVLPPTGQSEELNPSPQAQELTIRAIPVLQFDTDTLTVTADGSATVHFINEDTKLDHSFAVYTDSTALQPLAAGSIGAICNGPCSNDVQFALPGPGTYYFQCDVPGHANLGMQGQFIVQAPVQQPTDTPTDGGTTGATATPTDGGTQLPQTGTGAEAGSSGGWWVLAMLAGAGVALVGLGAVSYRRVRVER